jgi:hypothetical protein
VIVLSSLITLGHVLGALTSFSAVETYREAVFSDEAVYTAYDATTLFGLLTVPVWIVTSIWLASIRGNAVRLAPHQVRRGAAWCWFGWIVPVVCLWFPKRMVDDVWRATAGSLPPGHPDRREPSWPMATGLWWGLWVVSSALNRGSNQLQSKFGTRPDGGIFPLLEFALAGTSVAALVLWIRLVRNLTRVQRALVTGPPAPVGPVHPQFHGAQQITPGPGPAWAPQPTARFTEGGSGAFGS